MLACATKTKPSNNSPIGPETEYSGTLNRQVIGSYDVDY